MNARTPQLKFILVSVLLDMLAIGLAIPVMPELVGRFTSSAQEQSYAYGLLVAAFGLTQFLAAPLLGALSDRFGRRPVLLASVAGLGLDFILTGLAQSLTMLAAARILGGLTSASFIVASGYAADISTPQERAKNFGLIGAMMGVGFTAGPMLGGLLGHIDLRLPFFAAAALALAAAVYGWLAVPESLPADKRRALDWARISPLGSLVSLWRRPELKTLVLLFALVTFGTMVLQATWVLYGIQRYGWRPLESGLSLLVVGSVACVVQGGLIGRLVARFGEARVVLIGLASSVLGYLAFGLALSTLVLLSIVVLNFASFAVAPALQALASRAAGEREQGQVQGALGSLTSLIAVAAPLVGTALLGQSAHLAARDWRVGTAFYVCALLQLLALALAWRGLHRGDRAVPAVAAATTPA